MPWLQPFAVSPATHEVLHPDDRRQSSRPARADRYLALSHIDFTSIIIIIT